MTPLEITEEIRDLDRRIALANPRNRASLVAQRNQLRIALSDPSAALPQENFINRTVGRVKGFVERQQEETAKVIAEQDARNKEINDRLTRSLFNPGAIGSTTGRSGRSNRTQFNDTQAAEISNNLSGSFQDDPTLVRGDDFLPGRLQDQALPTGFANEFIDAPLQRERSPELLRQDLIAEQSRISDAERTSDFDRVERQRIQDNIDERNSTSRRIRTEALDDFELLRDRRELELDQARANFDDAARAADVNQASAQFRIDQQRAGEDRSIALAEQRLQDSREQFQKDKVANAARLAFRAAPGLATSDAATSALSESIQSGGDTIAQGVDRIFQLSRQNRQTDSFSPGQLASLGFESAYNALDTQDTDSAELQLAQLRAIRGTEIDPALQYRASVNQFGEGDRELERRAIALEQREFDLTLESDFQAAMKSRAATIGEEIRLDTGQTPVSPELNARQFEAQLIQEDNELFNTANNKTENNRINEAYQAALNVITSDNPELSDAGRAATIGDLVRSIPEGGVRDALVRRLSGILNSNIKSRIAEFRGSSRP